MSRWAELDAEFIGDPKWLKLDQLYVGRENHEDRRYVVTCPTGSEYGPTAMQMDDRDGLAVIHVSGPLRDTFDHDVFHALAWFVEACDRCLVSSATFKWDSDTGPTYTYEWNRGEKLRRTDERGVLDVG